MKVGEYTFTSPSPDSTDVEIMRRTSAEGNKQVVLGYGGTRRLIRPLEVRETKDGHLTLVAERFESDEPRYYRVDRIEEFTVLPDYRFPLPTFRLVFGISDAEAADA